MSNEPQNFMCVSGNETAAVQTQAVLKEIVTRSNQVRLPSQNFTETHHSPVTLARSVAIR